MKFHYYPETDSLYIELSEKASVDSTEVAPGVVLDFDAEGHEADFLQMYLPQKPFREAK